jgi:hypothetical protein
VPFVQGQLRGEPLSVWVESECAHCHRPLHLEIDGQLNFGIKEAEAGPMVFAPMVDFDKLEYPSIIDAF